MVLLMYDQSNNHFCLLILNCYPDAKNNKHISNTSNQFNAQLSRRKQKNVSRITNFRQKLFERNQILCVS